MSDRQKVLLGGGVLIVVALLLWHRFFSVSQPAYAEVIQVRGEVSLTARQATGPVAPGDRLEEGDRVATADDSSLTLRFADGSLMLVSENSDLVLDSLLRSADAERTATVIEVNSGRVESSVTEQTGFGARYEVRTPAIQLAVRGTEFTVGVDPRTGTSSGMVNEGRVAVSSDARELMLEPGYGTVAAADGNLTAPQRLLPAPNLDPRQSVEHYLPLHVQWAPQQEATAYRVQLLTAGNDSHLIREWVVAEPSLDIDELSDRAYRVKVRSIDALGLESAAAEQRFTLDAHPLPPVPTFPLGQRVDKQTVNFAWEASPEARHYLFQVSDSEEFSRLITQIKGLPSTLERLPVWLQPGRYYWRIAGYHPDEGLGPFAPAQRFTVPAPTGE